MARDLVDTVPLEGRADLIGWFEAGIKPQGSGRIGTEHEKIVFYRQDHAPVPYAGGIRLLLEGLQKSTGWEGIFDAENLIGLFDPVTGGAISLEPGGQFELSGAPFISLHETAAEFDAHMAALTAIAEPLGIGFLSLGTSPIWSRAQTPIMPKARYDLMRAYMPKVGTRGLDMMLRTATVQANFDFMSEADMVQKLRVSLSLQPLATALFAHSPFLDGAPTGALSTRSEIWRDTDNARAGMLPFAFEQGFGFEQYVDYALDVPMYFLKRGATYLDASGQSFRDLLAARLPAAPGEQATVSDWANHLSTIFPEVRLKRYLEMRGADMGARDMVLALPAFWTGLLYDTASLDAAWQLVKGWNHAERQALRDAVPREGLAAKIQGRSLLEIARQVLPLAQTGLMRRGKRPAGARTGTTSPTQEAEKAGADESVYLAPLMACLEHGQTRAQTLLERYHSVWRGDLTHAFQECIL